VQFAAISFRYKDDVPLIDDLSLEIVPRPEGRIVGPTGAGKTTLVNLLMRFYDVDRGAIRIDGVDIRELKRGRFVRCSAWCCRTRGCSQARFARTSPTGAAAQAKTRSFMRPRAAQADHFIRTLPENYDTPINEEASNLSQGQKQLLTIARAFLADPAILILDEATSSVTRAPRC
jgi:ATP-binding cassette subfamily B protein